MSVDRATDRGVRLFGRGDLAREGDERQVCIFPVGLVHHFPSTSNVYPIAA